MGARLEKMSDSFSSRTRSVPCGNFWSLCRLVYCIKKLFLVKKKPSLIRPPHPVNTANFFWPIGNRINGVPLYFRFCVFCLVLSCLHNTYTIQLLIGYERAIRTTSSTLVICLKQQPITVIGSCLKQLLGSASSSESVLVDL